MKRKQYLAEQAFLKPAFAMFEEFQAPVPFGEADSTQLFPRSHNNFVKEPDETFKSYKKVLDPSEDERQNIGGLDARSDDLGEEEGMSSFDAFKEAVNDYLEEDRIGLSMRTYVADRTRANATRLALEIARKEGSTKQRLKKIFGDTTSFKLAVFKFDYAQRFISSNSKNIASYDILKPKFDTDGRDSQKIVFHLSDNQGRFATMTYTVILYQPKFYSDKSMKKFMHDPRGIWMQDIYPPQIVFSVNHLEELENPVEKYFKYVGLIEKDKGLSVKGIR